MNGSSRFSDKIIQIILASTIKWGGKDDDNDAKKAKNIFFSSQVDCLATSTKVSDENKTHIHTTNDYYCNFVLGISMRERRKSRKMHIL